MAKVFKHNDLYEKIISYDNLKIALKKVTKGDRKHTFDAILFLMKEEKNLVELWRDLKRGTYEVGSYIQFYVYEPKKRWISAPCIRDKVVQTAVHNVIKDVYKGVFVEDSYACLEGKGPQRAAQQLQNNMRIAEREFVDPWIVSVDVSRFFYSIDRGITKILYRKKISCKKTLWLMDRLINSSPEGDTGIPLGCTTSQDSANINLNEVDQYVMRFLGQRYYVRYMDDMNIVVDGKKEAQLLKQQICNFMRDRLNLVENPKKSQIFPLDQGVNAYGYKIWTSHMKVRDDSKRKMKRKIKAMDKKLNNGEIELHEVQQSVNSWLGHARHSNSFNLAKRILKNYPYIKIEGNEYFGERRLD